MTEHIVSLLVIPLWITSASGWAGWIAAYALITPWRFL